MTSKRWKDDERHVAAVLHGKRTVVSGGLGAASKADVLAGVLFIEVKRRRRFAPAVWFEEVREKALHEHLLPVLVVHLSGTPIWYTMIDLSLFVELGLRAGLILDVESADFAVTGPPVVASVSTSHEA